MAEPLVLRKARVKQVQKVDPMKTVSASVICGRRGNPKA